MEVNHLTPGLVQIDDAFSTRLLEISRKAAEINNCIASINKLPPETVAHIATFFAKERDLVNATAVCQRWRTVLLSFQRLWCNAGGSASEIQAYIERSGSMPIIVNLPSPGLAELIAPHTNRLVGLAVRMGNPRSCLSRIAKHLRQPIPTLRTLYIYTNTPSPHKVEFAFDLRHAFFLHSRKLDLVGITSFRRSLTTSNPTLKAFPHVTELTLRTNEHASIDIDDFLNTLEQFPTLKRLSITFAISGWYGGRPPIITLPRVQEMSVFALRRDKVIPPIIGLINFPKLTSLRLQIPLPTTVSLYPIFPSKSFGEHLPNLTDLPDLQITMDKTSSVTFRNPQAVFGYVATEGFRIYHRDRVIWGALPLHTVRRLIVDVRDPCEDVDGEWFVEMFREVPNLERVEFRGEFPTVVQRLYRRIHRGLRDPVRTLVANAAAEYETRGVPPCDLHSRP